MLKTLYGVGVGPGDPELMTIKALNIIKECDYIALPISGAGETVAYNIARGAYPDIEKKPMLELSMPMSRDKEVLRHHHQKAASQIAEVLDKGLSAAFLTLGDPTVYSTYIYVHEIMKERGYSPVIVPGVPSFCAAAARLSVSLTEASQPLCILPGSYENSHALLDLSASKVLMKTGRSAGRIRELIREKNIDDDVYVIQNCGMENEKITSLEEMDESYFSIIILKSRAEE